MAGRSPQDPPASPDARHKLRQTRNQETNPTRRSSRTRHTPKANHEDKSERKATNPKNAAAPPPRDPARTESPPLRPERGQRRMRNVRERSGPRRPPAPAHGGPAPAPRRSPQRSAINPSTKLCLCVNPPAEQDPHPRQRPPFQNKGAKSRSGADPRAPRPGTRRPPHDAPSKRGENNPNETSLGKDENNEKTVCCSAGSCHAAQPGRDRVCR